MKITRVLLLSIIFLNLSATVNAQETKGGQMCAEPSLGVIFDATYVSRYIWRGYDTYPDNHSAIQPSIDIDLYETGFGINVWSSMANRSGFEDDKEIDYTVYYYNSFFDKEIYAVNYRLGWSYYSYPVMPRTAADMQELFATFCLPNICPLGIIPSYTPICTWPSEKNSDVRENGGWLHIFGLCYDLTMPNIIPERTFHLTAETIYNDGAYGSTHDWSHAVFGISTSFNVTKNLTFTPAFYYQSSWEKSVNEHDEHWISLSLTYQF